MTFATYFQLFLIALLGSTLQVTFKLRSLQAKAKLSNVQFHWKDALKDDAFAHIGNIITIVMAIMVTGEILQLKPEIVNYLKIAYAFVGYTGSDIALRFFSLADKKLNAAIDYKTTQADSVSGTLDAPTPPPSIK